MSAFLQLIRAKAEAIRKAKNSPTPLPVAPKVVPLAAKPVERRCATVPRQRKKMKVPPPGVEPLFAYILLPDDYEHAVACGCVVAHAYRLKYGKSPPRIWRRVPTEEDGALRWAKVSGYTEADRRLIATAVRLLDEMPLDEAKARLTANPPSDSDSVSR